jgi:hypothetical protein
VTDEQKKQIARQLRVQGKTPAYISRQIGVPSPTVDRWTKDIYQARQREIDKQARILATQGVSAIRISQQLGIDVARVRKIARIELDAYQQRAKAQVKSLARAGINPAQIATQVGTASTFLFFIFFLLVSGSA